MNGTQIHLIFNHVPVLGAVGVVFLLAVGLWFRSDAILRLSLAVLVVSALAALPVFFSGEPTEERIENLAGVDEATIERHEDAARLATIALEVLGITALFGLWHSRRRSVSRPLASLLLVVALGGAGLLGWAAHLGGLVRHPELRGGATAAAAQPGVESHEDD